MPLFKSDNSTFPAYSFSIPAAGALEGTLQFLIFENASFTDVKDMNI